jgi:AhpD family alkylhydroperoxidase
MGISLVDVEDMVEPYRSIALRTIDDSGDAYFFQGIANSPALLDFFCNDFYGKIFNGGLLPVVLKELVRFRLAQAHGCGHCMKVDTASLKRLGVPLAKIQGVQDFEQGPFDDAEKAAFRLADVLVYTNLDGHLDDDLSAELRRHYSDAEIMELALVIAVITGTAKMMFAFDLAEKVCEIPSFA